MFDVIKLGLEPGLAVILRGGELDVGVRQRGPEPAPTALRGAQAPEAGAVIGSPVE